MSAGWGPFPPVHQQAHAGLSQGTLSRGDQRDDPAASALISNQAPHRQDQKSGRREDAEDQGNFPRERMAKATTSRPMAVLAWCEPAAIAEEFQDAGIDNSARRKICGLAARPSRETSTGCGLAQSRARDVRILRRAHGVPHMVALPRAVDKKAAHPPKPARSRRATHSSGRRHAWSASVIRSFHASKGCDTWQAWAYFTYVQPHGIGMAALTGLNWDASSAIPHG